MDVFVRVLENFNNSEDLAIMGFKCSWEDVGDPSSLSSAMMDEEAKSESDWMKVALDSAWVIVDNRQ